jgi:hypothetical protein
MGCESLAWDGGQLGAVAQREKHDNLQVRPVISAGRADLRPPELQNSMKLDLLTTWTLK